MHKLKFLTISIIVVMSLILAGPSFDVSARPLAATDPPLGRADSFAVLAKTAVTDVPASIITGDVGLANAGTNYAGLTTAEVSGTIYDTNGTGPAGPTGNNPALVNGAQSDLVTTFNNASGQTPVTPLGGADNQVGAPGTLAPGVYSFGHATTANLIGTVALDGQNDPNSVFIFIASSDLVFAANSVVQLIRKADACHVWWVVNSSATLNTRSTVVGTIMALASISDAGDSNVQGRLLARTGQVSLIRTVINRPVCASSGGGGGGGKIGGLPNTGGGPIRTEDFPWSLVIVLGGFSAIALVLGVLAYRRTHLPKQ